MHDWFASLKGIVSRHEPIADAHALPRAAAALLLELAMMEGETDAAELEVVHAAMRGAFDIPPAELEALLEQAHHSVRDAVSLHEFTRQLRTGLGPEQRAELVEWLWRVAFADSRLGMHEEHLLRRIADLLGVSHQEFIRRKLLAGSG